MNEFTPSEQQAEALAQIRSFLEKIGHGVFILKGYAGTGKTTLLQQLGLELRRKKKEFVMLAPTGRAATVLRAKTGIATATIHSELYRFSEIDGEPDQEEGVPAVDEYGQMRLMFALRMPEEEEEKLYIVDEASMISDELSDVTSNTQFGSGHLLSDLLAVVGTNKIIFAGDPSQLPPVGSEDSPALSAEWMEAQGKYVSAYELTDILRQKEGSEILQLATEVRFQTQQTEFPKWLKLPAMPGDQINLMHYPEMLEAYMQHIEDKGFDQSIAVCHSNFQCSEINKAVRHRLYGDPLILVQEGDLLMITQNNYQVPVTNGDFVTIVSVGMRHSHIGIGFVQVRIRVQLTGKEHDCMLCEDPLYNGSPNLSQEQQRNLMIEFSMQMRMKRVKPRSAKFTLALQQDEHLNSLRANFGYAVTCHKSQGGEWDHVFFFLSRGMYTMQYPGLCRWWYTGITRARKQLYVVKDWWVGRNS